MAAASPATYIPLRLMPGVAALLELSGHDEQAVAASDSVAAIDLLDRVLADTPLSDIKPGQAVDLPSAERDYLLAQIYIDNFGDRVSADHHCVHCEERYEVTFLLSELLQQVDRQRLYNTQQLVEMSEQKVAPGAALATPHYLLKNGLMLRLPGGREDLALLRAERSDAEAVLLACCAVDGDSTGEAASSTGQVLQAMEELAPLLDLDMDSHCPECGGVQQVRFSMQGYLLNTLRACKSSLVREVHTLASMYHWSLYEILALSRRQRQALLDCIEEN